LAFFLAPPWPPLFPCRRGRQGLWRPADGGEEEVEEEGEADEDAVAASCPCWVWWWAGGQVTSATCPKAHSSSTRRRKAGWKRTLPRSLDTRHHNPRTPPPPSSSPSPPRSPLHACVNLPRKGLAGRRPWRKRRWRVERLESVMSAGLARWRCCCWRARPRKQQRAKVSPSRRGERA